MALAPNAVRAVVDGGGLTDLTTHFSRWRALLAVRSSAIGEDGPTASFAGQHVTRLGVRATEGALRAAIRAVAASVDSPHANAYRQAVASGRADTTGMATPIAVLVQPLIQADVAGVMFTRDPITGSDELVVEGAFGLGDSVVGGKVTPELCRMSRYGTVRQRRPGRQSVAVVASAAGGTLERPLEPGRASRGCLDECLLAALAQLAQQCRDVFGDGGLDIEWSWAVGHIGLLQARPITTLHANPRPVRAPGPA
jgi:pyruvate,water dikinase